MNNNMRLLFLFLLVASSQWVPKVDGATWKTAASGDWDTTTNWNPTGVPIDTAILNNTGSFTVTLTSFAGLSTSLTLGGTGSNPTLVITGRLTVPTVTFISGKLELRSGGQLIVGTQLSIKGNVDFNISSTSGVYTNTGETVIASGVTLSTYGTFPLTKTFRFNATNSHIALHSTSDVGGTTRFVGAAGSVIVYPDGILNVLALGLLNTTAVDFLGGKIQANPLLIINPPLYISIFNANTTVTMTKTDMILQQGGTLSLRAGGSINMDSESTLVNQGSIDVQASTFITGALDNQNTINVADSATLTIDGAANVGTVSLGSGSTLAISNASFGKGTITGGQTSQVTIAQQLHVNGNSQDVAEVLSVPTTNQGSIIIDSGTLKLSSVSIGGSLSVNSPGKLVFNGATFTGSSITNSGTITTAGAGVQLNPSSSSLSITGTVPGAIDASVADLQVTSGSLTLAGILGIAGTFNTASSTSISISGQTTTTASTTFTGTTTVEAGGTLVIGSATETDTLSLTSGGTVTVNGGRLTINNALSLAASTLQINAQSVTCQTAAFNGNSEYHISFDATPDVSEVLQVTGLATLGSSASCLVDLSAAIAAGASINIMKFGSVSGQFASLNVSNQLGSTFRLTYDNSFAKLLNSTPIPTTANPTGSSLLTTTTTATITVTTGTDATSLSSTSSTNSSSSATSDASSTAGASSTASSLQQHSVALATGAAIFGYLLLLLLW